MYQKVNLRPTESSIGNGFVILSAWRVESATFESDNCGWLLYVDTDANVPDSDTLVVYGIPGSDPLSCVVLWHDELWVSPVLDEMFLLVNLRSLVMGFKGTSHMDSGYLFCPYIPIIKTPIIDLGNEPYDLLLEPVTQDTTGYQLLAAWRVTKTEKLIAGIMVTVDSKVEEPVCDPLTVFGIAGRSPAIGVICWRDQLWSVQQSDLDNLLGILTRYGKKLLSQGAKYYQRITINSLL